jgi:phytoene dehydrogenase-like protein
VEGGRVTGAAVSTQESGRRERADVVVIGAGHNGLVCAAYLARAGLRTLVLERRSQVGGAVGTEAMAPGVRAPAAGVSVGRLRPSVARDLGLRSHRLRLVQPDARITAVSDDGPPLTLWGDGDRTAGELRTRSSDDADAWPRFDRQTRRLGGILGRLMAMAPPDPSRPAPADALAALRVALGLRDLGADDTRQLLRVLPMAIADHAEDWFQDPTVRALLSWRGVRYTAMGPRDAGTAHWFLADAAGTDAGAAGEMVLARGGPGALAEALAGAARAAGAEIRCGVAISRVLADERGVHGVELPSGASVEAPVVVSGTDPKRTLLELVDPAVLGPQLGWQAGNIRLRGSVATVDLAVSDLPAPDGLGDDADAGRRLRGRILLGASLRALDHAADAVKGGHPAEQPILEVAIPSLLDPSLVDAGASARHVVSVLVQGVPYHRRDGGAWDGDREALGDRVTAALERLLPGVGARVVGRRVRTPLDLERDLGLTEGHPLHGEPGLDQWFAWRPLLGWARYRMPVDGLYLCGAGAHPGGGVTGAPGALAARAVLADGRARA